MLGIAVTCPGRQTFIARIGGLDQETQHSLTQSLKSFIIIKVSVDIKIINYVSHCAFLSYEITILN